MIVYNISMIVASLHLNTMSLRWQFHIQLKLIRQINLFFLNEAIVGKRSTVRGESLGMGEHEKQSVKGTKL